MNDETINYNGVKLTRKQANIVGYTIMGLIAATGFVVGRSTKK